MKSWIAIWWVRIIATILYTILLGGAISLMGLANVWSATLYLVAMILLLLFVEKSRGSVQTSGLVWHTNTVRLITFGGAIALGIIAVFTLAALTLGSRFDTAQPTVASLPLSLLTIVVVSSFEEILFRGTIFEAIHDRFGAAVAVLGTSILFGAAHMANPASNMQSVLNTVLAGILLGVLVTQTHTLYAAISFHACWNVLVGLVVGNVSGIDFGIALGRLDFAHVAHPWLFGRDYGIEEGALTTGLLVIAVLLTLRYAPLDAETRAARYRRSFSESYKQAW